jgi:hypothetical protein
MVEWIEDFDNKSWRFDFADVVSVALTTARCNAEAGSMKMFPAFFVYGWQACCMAEERMIRENLFIA